MSENRRFGELIKKLGFKNQTEFATALGLKQGSISGIILEKKKAVVSSNTKNRLKKDFNVNIEWLETGEGEWRINEDVADSSYENQINKFTDEDYARLTPKALIKLTKIMEQSITFLETSVKYKDKTISVLEERVEDLKDRNEELKHRLSQYETNKSKTGTN